MTRCRSYFRAGVKLASVLALAGLFRSLPAYSGNQIAIMSGESLDLSTDYYVANCASLLLNIDGVDLLEGPPGVRLSFRNELVYARAQRCTVAVPGTITVLTAPVVSQKIGGQLVYRVRLSTEEGPKIITRTMWVTVYPK